MGGRGTGRGQAGDKTMNEIRALEKFCRIVGALPHQRRMATILFAVNGLDNARYFLLELQRRGRTTRKRAPARKAETKR